MTRLLRSLASALGLVPRPVSPECRAVLDRLDRPDEWSLFDWGDTIAHPDGVTLKPRLMYPQCWSYVLISLNGSNVNAAFDDHELYAMYAKAKPIVARLVAGQKEQKAAAARGQARAAFGGLRGGR